MIGWLAWKLLEPLHASFSFASPERAAVAAVNVKKQTKDYVSEVDSWHRR
jgi:hypothetical protein